MGHLREVDGNSQLSGQYSHALYVVLVLVGNEDRIKRAGVFPCDVHALEDLTAGESCINQDASAAGGDDCAVSLRATGQHRHAHHAKSIRQR